MAERKTIFVVGAVVWKDGLFLSAERPEGKDYAGWWEFPGGKIEEGESRSDALIREMQEELGITPTSFDLWIERVFDYPEYIVEFSLYDVWEFTGEVQSLENQQFDWFDIGNMRDVKFLPVNYELLELLKKRGQGTTPAG